MAKRIPDFLPDLMVWDVGASKKPVRVFATASNKICMYAFEPNEVEALKTEDNWGQIPWKLLRVVHKALADFDGITNLYITHDPGYSSIFPPNPDLAELYRFGEKARVLRIEPVPVVRGENLVTGESGVPAPDFIKIDTQGSELGVLRGLGEQTLSTLLGAQVETEFVSMYQGQPLFDEVMSLLRANQIFPVALRTTSVSRANSKFPRTRFRTLYSHTLFLRNSWDTNLSGEQRKKLAILYGLFGFFDDSLYLFETSELQETEARKALNWLNRQPFSFGHSGSKSGMRFDLRQIFLGRKQSNDQPNWRRGDSSLPA